MYINMLPERFTPDGMISIENAEFIDDEMMTIINQQRLKANSGMIGVCIFDPQKKPTME